MSDLENCPSSIRLIVSLDDGRSFSVTRDKAMRNSCLLFRLIGKEGKRLNQEIMNIQRTRERQTRGYSLSPDDNVNATLNLEEKLAGTKFSDFALRSIQNFWDTDTLLDYEDNMEHMLEELIAFSYLEMNGHLCSLRKILVDKIGAAQTLEEARLNLNVESDFELPKDEKERVFVELFKKAWSSYGNAELERRAQENALNHMPQVDSFRSVISKPSSSSSSSMSIPPEVFDRRNEIEENCKPDAKECYMCHNQFSYFYGYSAHTCRCCGARICGNCSDSAELPFPPLRKNSTSLYSMWNKTTSGKELVCKQCKKILDDVGMRYSLWSQAMTAACLPPYLACRAASISQQWYDSAKDYVFRFRKLQHRLPTQPYTKEEKALIWMNRTDFACHPLWIIQLLRVADWDDAKVCEEVHKIILKKVSGTPCSSLLCTKDCARCGLRPIDCLVALNGHLFHLPQVIRCALVSILETAPDEELLNYIPQLVHYVRFDEFPYDILPVSDPLELSGTNDGEGEGSCFGRPPDAVPNDVFNYEKCDKSPLIRMLLRRCLHGDGLWKDAWRQLCFEFYWAISVEASSGVGTSSSELRDFSYSGLYNHLRNAVVMRLSMNFPEGRQMLHGISSQYALMDILRDKERAKKQIGKLVERGTLFLPFDSSYVLSGVDLDHMKVMESAKKPVIMPCSCVPTKSVLQSSDGPQQNEMESFMFKMDDLRKDLVVMKCTSIIKSLFAQDKVLKQLPCVTYRVQPVTKCAGFIELVDGETLSKVGSLSEYLLNKVTIGNRGTSVFIQSAAVASVLVYLFGIGDRHTDNLLVTTDGKLVNIDFGFLEGEDTMGCPYARIPDDVINYGDNRKVFFEWCKCVYLQIRRYAMHFHSLLMFLHTTEEDPEASLKKFDDFIQDRFCVEQDEEVALKKLEEFLENSQKSAVNNGVRDATHKGKRVMVDAFYSLMAWWSGKTSETMNESPAAAAATTAIPVPNQAGGNLKSILVSSPGNPRRLSRATSGSQPNVSAKPPEIPQSMILDDSFSNPQQNRTEEDDDPDSDGSGFMDVPSFS